MRSDWWRQPVHFFAYGFGTGLMPILPGTFGSLVGILLFWFMASLAPLRYAGIVAVLGILGVFITSPPKVVRGVNSSARTACNGPSLHRDHPVGLEGATD